MSNHLARQPLHCDRCGHDMTVHRGGQIRYDDFLELWHDYFALEQELRTELARCEARYDAARERCESLRWLVGQLEVPTLEQLEVRSLRAQLDALVPQTDEDSTVQF